MIEGMYWGTESEESRYLAKKIGQMSFHGIYGKLLSGAPNWADIKEWDSTLTVRDPMEKSYWLEPQMPMEFYRVGPNQKLCPYYNF